MVHPGVDLAFFTHSVKTRANGVKFAHQSLCNPKISTLIKAIRKGFLKGCPNQSENLILKYLNSSLATANGHMKRTRHGIRSTRRTQLQTAYVVPRLDGPSVPLPAWMQLPDSFLIPQGVGPTLIANDDELIVNVFCYGAFVDKRSGVVYNDLTGKFPSFRLMVAFVSSCFTIMRQMRFWQRRLQG